MRESAAGPPRGYRWSPSAPSWIVLAGLVIFCLPLGACGACGSHPASSSTTTTTTTSSTSTTSGGTGGSGGSGEAESGCVTMCATQATLGCPKGDEASCISVCESGKTMVSWCAEVVADAVDCLALEPASSFMCDAFGNPAAKPGFCAAELNAIQTCWHAGPRAGLPDLRRACADTCAKQAALPCADPRCATNCVDVLRTGSKCNGAFAALVACSARQEHASYFCGPVSPLPSLPMWVCAFEQSLLVSCLQRP